MSAAPILITVPRYVTIPRLRPDVVAVASRPPVAEVCGNASDSVEDDPIDEFLVRGKKRRLDHLSWEEKFQRK